ncbi:MAG TPA: hypothetical protein DDY13_06210 [Cytophagales bacterium]|jgi:outer membrane protein|nr:hypothetical protein [Cytophagales bacterium]
MKIKLVITAIALFFVSQLAVAQSDLKIGYTNVDFILSQLPEAKQIESDLKDYEKQLSTQLENKLADYRTKAEDFQKNAPNMIPEVRADRQQELMQMQQSIDEFQRNAQGALQQKQVQLLQPAYDKIQKAIDDVAKENGYTHVFSSDQGGVFILLYAREEDNITNIVLKKLGIEPPAETTGTE